jgi:galactoside O-acetyltransferase
MKEIPFKSLGKDTKISPLANFHHPENIEIGDNTRIDDYCVFSGGSGLKIGSHIHIACYVSLFAGSGIEIADFCQLGAYSILLSESDDFSGHSLIGPQVPIGYKPGYKKGKIIFERHVTLGARCTILPGVHMGEGAIVGACSLVNRNCQPWTLYAGIPVKNIKGRSDEMLLLEKQFLQEREEKFLQGRIDGCYAYDRDLLNN